MEVSVIAHMVDGLPESIDLTADSNVLKATSFKVTDPTVTESKPARLDANKQLISGNIDLTSEVDNVLPVANGGTNSSTTLVNNRVMRSLGDKIVEADPITASRALISDAAGIPTHSDITAAEIAHLDGVTSNIQTQINNLQTGYSRRTKVINLITDNTVAPPTEVEGDRYILQTTGGAPHADWDGASAGDIVQFTSGSWVKVSPLEGYVAYCDTLDRDLLYVDDGTPEWEIRKVQSIDLSNAKIWVGNASNEAAEQTPGGDLSMANDGTFTIVANAVDGSKLRLANNETLRARNALDTDDVEILKVNTSNEPELVNHTKTPSSAPTDDYHIANKKYVDDELANKKHFVLNFPGVAGEAFEANRTFVVRYGLNGEDAGKVYKASSDHENLPNKFWGIGVVQTGSALVADDPVEVIKYAETLNLKASDTNFDALDDGLPLFLNKGGSFSTDAKLGIGVGDAYASFVVGQQKVRATLVTDSTFAVECGVGCLLGVDIA